MHRILATPGVKRIFQVALSERLNLRDPAQVHDARDSGSVPTIYERVRLPPSTTWLWALC
jgi:hypothetical protein